MTKPRQLVVAVLALATFAACGDDAKEPASTSAVTSTTTTTTQQEGVDPAAYVESGDYVNGRHAANITAFDETKVTFDVVQFLTGDAAKQAFHEEHPDMDGPDNDFYIRNQNKQLRTLPLAEAVVIRVNNSGGYPPSDPDKGHEVNRATFASYVKAGDLAGPFWLTIVAGEVTAIEEQYTP